MLLNNRPVMENMNRQNDAYRNNSEKAIDTYTIILGVICVIISVLFFVNRSVGFGLFFLGLAILLWVVAFLSRRAELRDEQARQRSKEKNDTQAIFKEHED